MLLLHCKNCKKEFFVKAYRLKSALYCSRKCKGVYDAKRIKKFNIGFKKGMAPWNKGKKGVMPIPWNFAHGFDKGCLLCKKIFHFSPSKIKQGRAKYCSQRCWMDSKERKLMMSKVHKGKKCPYAKPPKMFGEDNYNWKGGITPINTKIRNSLVYKMWRKNVFERDNYTCQICNQRGNKLHADHIKPFALYPKLRLSINNGRTLCVPCHKKTDTYLSKIKLWQKSLKQEIHVESL